MIINKAKIKINSKMSIYKMYKLAKLKTLPLLQLMKMEAMKKAIITLILVQRGSDLWQLFAKQSCSV